VAEDLVKRLKVQVTTPVVPGMMGQMLYEQDEVLASVDFALAELAREDALARSLFAEVLTFQRVGIPPDAPPPPAGTYQPSAELAEAALQARELLDGKPSATRSRPTASITFSVDRASPPAP
jgi:hypothetical protein